MPSVHGFSQCVSVHVCICSMRHRGNVYVCMFTECAGRSIDLSIRNMWQITYCISQPNHSWKINSSFIRLHAFYVHVLYSLSWASCPINHSYKWIDFCVFTLRGGYISRSAEACRFVNWEHRIEANSTLRCEMNQSQRVYGIWRVIAAILPLNVLLCFCVFNPQSTL